MGGMGRMATCRIRHYAQCIFGAARLGVRLSRRPIDHLVLPVTDLGRARTRLTTLGFTVAADALHPFGTSNACVFLSDGTYLEPLAIANRRLASAAAKRGNAFTARDLAFRRTRNREGLSAIVGLTDEALADDRSFREAGLSGGEVLEFSRAMTLPGGEETIASFRLAFAAASDDADFFAFCCERINPLPADRGELEMHANAVTGLSEVILTSPEPAAASALLETAFGPDIHADGTGIRLSTGNAAIRIVRQEALLPEFGLEPDGRLGGLNGRLVIFKSADLAVTEITLAANDVAFIRREGRVLVAASPGQGVMFGFEE